MKQYNKLKRFPLGTIKAEGFLKEQLLIGKDGMAGHLYELEPESQAGVRKYRATTGQDTFSTHLLLVMKK